MMQLNDSEDRSVSTLSERTLLSSLTLIVLLLLAATAAAAA
jgi:hypothetical protein